MAFTTLTRLRNTVMCTDHLEYSLSECPPHARALDISLRDNQFDTDFRGNQIQKSTGRPTCSRSLNIAAAKEITRSLRATQARWSIQQVPEQIWEKDERTTTEIMNSARLHLQCPLPTHQRGNRHLSRPMYIYGCLPGCIEHGHELLSDGQGIRVNMLESGRSSC